MIMIKLSRGELRKIASALDYKREALEYVRDTETEHYDYLERCIANREAELLMSLTNKLLQIADSDAKRVEIINY